MPRGPWIQDGGVRPKLEALLGLKCKDQFLFLFVSKKRNIRQFLYRPPWLLRNPWKNSINAHIFRKCIFKCTFFWKKVISDVHIRKNHQHINNSLFALNTW